MSGMDRIGPGHNPLLSMKFLLLLTICLGSFSIHFLAENSEHFLWQTQAEVSNLQAEHCDHQDQFIQSIKLMPVDCIASFTYCLMHNNLNQLFPPIAPPLNPPKSA